MHYEMFMAAAISEARAAARAGERPDGAVAVLGEAMVAGGHEQVRETGDPTAHAVIVTLREAAARLGRTSLEGLTVFSTLEPCAMCVGALLESDADGIVFAVPDRVAGAAGSALQLADHDGLARRLLVVSGILQSDAAELLDGSGAAAPRSRTGR
ncbi:MAG TPA: nucleoside deaminase [Candidatus Limnocylindrales bacterium]|nr:nucleoside deaminase [Candidatus Limnocylindrales bacterium]